jgi:hypothetical protein
MRWLGGSILARLAALQVAASFALAHTTDGPQHPIDDPPATSGVSASFFAELERLSRLVDISYCIGNTGISKPFSCMSRCSDFPTLKLVNAWNTGLLLSDSCGYVAVDDGEPNNESSGTGNGGGDIGSRAIIVAFRGTYSITNTIVDLSTVPQEYVPYPAPGDGEDGDPGRDRPECHNCTVHMGFWESWKNARKEVIPTLEKLREEYPDYPIYLVGHSLGGAVASLAALELKVAKRWDNVIVTTFGEPRVGNSGLVRFLDEAFGLNDESNLEERLYRRVTHYNDPVPLLPLGEWGYRSHGGEVFITKENLSPSETDLHMCVGDSDQSCSAGADSGDWEVPAAEVEMLRVDIETSADVAEFPTRYKLWQLFFAHRDYFWRLGLCVPGGDPANWGRPPYQDVGGDEL